MADNDNEKEEQEQAVVVYRYLPPADKQGQSYPGVPPGDILQHVYDAQPRWIQRSIDESPLYKKVEPKEDKKDKDKAAPAAAKHESKAEESKA